MRQAREAAGISQRQLAFSGCSPAYISRIEAGDRIPSLQILRELATKLDVDAEFLATGSRSLRDELDRAGIALRLGELDQAQTALVELERRAEGDERLEVIVELGNVAYRQGEVQRAIKLFESALETSELELDTHPALAESLGRAYMAAGRLPEAIALFRRFVAHQQSSGDVVRAIRFACLLGTALTDNAELNEAERTIASALERAESVTDARTRARAYRAQARALAERGRTEESSRYVRTALETLQSNDDAYTVAHAHQSLAHIYLDANQLDEAAAELDAGRALVEASAAPTELSLFTLEEARLHARRGETDRARSLAEGVNADLDDASPPDAGRAYVALGEIFETLGELERAIDMYELAIDRLEPLPMSQHLLTAQRRLASVLEQLDRPDLALNALKRALGTQERAASPEE